MSYISLSAAELVNRLLFRLFARLSAYTTYPHRASWDRCWHDRQLQLKEKNTFHAWFGRLYNCDSVYWLAYFFSIGARPKFTKRNSMDSVELWKYSSDKVISFSHMSVQHSREKCVCKSDSHIPPQRVINPALTVCSFTAERWEPRIGKYTQEIQESAITARQKKRLPWQSVIRWEAVVGLSGRHWWHHCTSPASSASEYLSPYFLIGFLLWPSYVPHVVPVLSLPYRIILLKTLWDISFSRGLNISFIHQPVLKFYSVTYIRFTNCMSVYFLSYP